jgi:hypothetical protein
LQVQTTSAKFDSIVEDLDTLTVKKVSLAEEVENKAATEP